MGILTHTAVLSLFLRAITNEAIFLYAGLGLVFSLFSIELFTKRLAWPTIWTVAAAPFLFCLSLFHNGPVDSFGNIVFLIASLHLAVMILRQPLNTSLVWLLYLSLQIYVLLTLVIAGLSPDLILANSRNYILVNLLAYFLLALFTDSQRGIKREKFYAFCAGLIWISALFSLSSSAIILSSVLLSYYLIKAASSSLRSAVIMVTIFVLYSAVAQFIGHNLALLGFQWILGSVESGYELLVKLDPARLLEGDIRYRIIEAYVTSLNGIEWVIGRNFHVTFEGVSNLHNSYLILHARYGVIGLLALVVSVLKLGLNFLLRRDVASLVAILFFVRGFSDTVFFSGSAYDFVLFLVLIAAWRDKVPATFLVAPRSRQLSW